MINDPKAEIATLTTFARDDYVNQSLRARDGEAIPRDIKEDRVGRSSLAMTLEIASPIPLFS